MNDNAHMESFFHTLKIKGLYKMRFDQDRLHSSLAYQPPGVFEKSHLPLTVH